jgi:DNA-directed RNA polymerase I subunit RPA2
VVAYTGYDMEDAMILNKSSVERGFAHATLYKTETIDLREEKGRDAKFAPEPLGRTLPPPSERERPVGAFGAEYPQMLPSTASSPAIEKGGIAPEGRHRDAAILDTDGLPHVGAVVWPGQPYYNTIDRLSGKGKGGKVKGEETAVVDQVTIVGTGKEKDLRQANIKLRFNRNPVIGDKFSSRHGQKGVLSRLYDDVDMPFNELTGMRPDLLINPHAFPSRMTIGMLIESLTGKAGALTGEVVDATPFQSSDGDAGDPTAEFGAALEAAGFARNGGETLISGVSGEPFSVDIYVGVVYYQRLRHMVSDKFQVRSTGPINPLTRQPIKRRKFGGGIRFGEMERDSLLAHGAAYLLHDRLHSCSDYHVMDVCANCGLLVSTANLPVAAAGATGVRATSAFGGAPRGVTICRLCDTGKYVERVALPFVFKYLVSELAAMNIRCSLDVK